VQRHFGVHNDAGAERLAGAKRFTLYNQLRNVFSGKGSIEGTKNGLKVWHE
jgi:hypothetical protein